MQPVFVCMFLLCLQTCYNFQHVKNMFKFYVSQQKHVCRHYVKNMSVSKNMPVACKNMLPTCSRYHPTRQIGKERDALNKKDHRRLT